jgi:hypothetical protein
MRMKPEHKVALQGLGLFTLIAILFGSLFQWAAEHPELKTLAWWKAQMGRMM